MRPIVLIGLISELVSGITISLVLLLGHARIKPQNPARNRPCVNWQMAVDVISPSYTLKDPNLVYSRSNVLAVLIFAPYDLLFNHFFSYHYLSVYIFVLAASRGIFQRLAHFANSRKTIPSSLALTVKLYSTLGGISA